MFQYLVMLLVVGTTISTAGADVQLSNVALNKPASQSSASASFPHLTANLAVDGLNRTTLHECQHTADKDEVDDNPFRWWIVDLQGFYDIHAVVVTNRNNPYGKRLKNFDVEVFVANPLVKLDAIAERCYHQSGPMEGGVTKRFDCGQPIRGRYVRIIMPSEGKPMHICEVEVLARIADVFSSIYTCTRGQKAEGGVISDMTSRGQTGCATACAQKVSCNAVNVESELVTSQGSRRRECQLLSFGGIGQPNSTTAQPHWDFCFKK